MLGSEITGAAVGSGEVDTEFWALVLHDEEWLAAEFTAIVGEPGETRVRSWGRPSRVDGAPFPMPVTPALVAGSLRPWRTEGYAGRRWRRERSPPASPGTR